MKKLEAVNKYISNIELEKGEILQRLEDDYSQIIEIAGKPHSKGGTPVQLTKNDRVFSNKIILPESIVSALTDKKGTSTPADLAKKYNPEKYQELLDHTDPLTRNSAKLMKAKYDAMLDSIFEAQELFKDSRNVKDGVLLKDQGLDANLNKVGAMGGTYKGDPGVDPRKRNLLGFSAFGKPIPIATYDDKNAYLNIYKSPDKFRKNPDGTPVNKEDIGYANQTPTEQKSIAKSSPTNAAPTTPKQVAAALAKKGTTNVAINPIPADEYRRLPEFVDSLTPEALKSLVSTIPNGAKYLKKDGTVNLNAIHKGISDGDVGPLTKAVYDISKRPVMSESPYLPTAIDKQAVNAFSMGMNGVPFTNNLLKTEAPTINPQRVADKTNSSKDPMSELIGFRDQQRFAQANLIQSILGQVASPVYTNPQETAIAQRYLPVNDLAAERAVNNARDTMFNSDMPSQITNALSGDLVSKAIEGTSKIDIQNAQGYVANENRNNANLQNVLYKNSVNSAKAKEDYVSKWQMALDQHDKEVQDNLYGLQDIELQKGQTQDQATMQEHLYRAAGKRFIPKAVVNKNGTVSYQYVMNPNWNPQDQTNRWFKNQDSEIDMIMRKLGSYTPEQQKIFLQYLKMKEKTPGAEVEGI